MDNKVQFIFRISAHTECEMYKYTGHTACTIDQASQRHNKFVLTHSCHVIAYFLALQNSRHVDASCLQITNVTRKTDEWGKQQSDAGTQKTN
jgi:hypothetical protein